MAKIPISVCIIARNEEKHIGNCLRHLSRYDLEVIVADTGSTDKTKEIALEYTDHVYDFAWVNDFSAARNFAAGKASNNWILVLDCDEYLIDLDVNAVRKCMQQNNKNVGVLGLRNVHTMPDGTQSREVDDIPRFYNKNFFEYRFRIHEQITPKNATDMDSVVLYTFSVPAVVDHHGYDIPPDQMAKKQERNLALLEASVGEGQLDDYLYFQIGQSNYIIGKYDKAAEAYGKCFALNSNMEKNFMPIALSGYAGALLKLERYAEAYGLLSRYEAHLTTAKEQFLLAKAVQGSGDSLKALLLLIKLTRLPDFETLGEDAYDVYGRILFLCPLTGNENKTEFFRRALVEYAAAHGREIVFQ